MTSFAFARGAMAAAALTMLAFSPAAAGGPQISAATDTGAGQRDIDFSYAVYVGGMEVIHLDFDLKLGEGRYTLDGATRMRGFFKRVLPWSMKLNTEGRFDSARLVPIKAHRENTWAGKRRWTTIRYADGTPRVVSAEPMPNGKAIPPQELRGLIDGASALLTVARASMSAKSCTVEVPFFDGRKVIKAEVRAMGEETLRKSRYSAYAGKAKACALGLAIGDGKVFHKRYGGKDDEARTITLWFAPLFDGVQPLPVRFEHDTKIGLVVGHLASAKLTGAGADRARVYKRKR